MKGEVARIEVANWANLEFLKFCRKGSDSWPYVKWPMGDPKFLLDHFIDGPKRIECYHESKLMTSSVREILRPGRLIFLRKNGKYRTDERYAKKLWSINGIFPYPVRGPQPLLKGWNRPSKIKKILLSQFQFVSTNRTCTTFYCSTKGLYMPNLPFLPFGEVQ